jgi:putative peptide zinc metalloprotease protein
MSEDSKKVVLPPFLIRRLEAFRVRSGNEQTYVLRDKLHGRTYDLEPWQFFILEVLPGCESLQKLQTVFKDRFDRELTQKNADEFLGSLADAKLLDEPSAEQHPLLEKFTRRKYVVEDGKAKPKPFAEVVAAAANNGTSAATAPSNLTQPQETPNAGEPALGLNWPDPKIKLPLFDPRPVLRWLAPALKPLWRVIYVAPFLLFATLYLGIYRHFELFTSDLAAIEANLSLVGHLIFAWLTVHFLGSMSAAVVATNYKVSVESVGFYPTFGFMPRWCLKMNGADRLTRRQMMWLHSAPLFMRIVLLGGGVILWFGTRGSHTELSQLGLLVTFTCIVGLTLEAGNPLLKAHAYYILCAYLGEPHLRGKAYMAIVNRLRGNVYQAYDRRLLALYGLLSLTWILVVTLIIARMLARYLLGSVHLNGSGIIIIAVFLSWMFWLNYTGLRKFGQDYDRKLQFDRWRSRALPQKADEAEGEVRSRPRSYWKLALLTAFLIILFLPYPYEPVGQFVIFPVVKEDLTTDTPGVITNVYFAGGEFVKKGTILARLAHDNYVAQFDVLTAQIKEQEHVVANLKTLPKPEDVKQAERELQIARTREPFTRAKAERLRPLWKEGAVTFEEYDTVVKEDAVDVAEVAEKEAHLQLVKTGPTAELIASEEAKLLAFKSERDGIQGKIDRTTIRMPFDGNILTLHLQDRVNSFLEPGRPFASVENTGYVTAQIQIQESDLQFVKLGMEARARPTSWFFDEFHGKVVVIDPDVTEKSFTTWVNVLALFDNHDGRLKTGMSGEAKLGRVSLPVWKAFTLSIERFFLVTVWSWIP